MLRPAGLLGTKAGKKGPGLRMARPAYVVCCFLLVLVAASALQCCRRASDDSVEAPPAQDIADLAFEPGEYFRLEEENGRWWFVTPDGEPFLSIGVNHVTWHGCTGKVTGERPYEEAVLAKYGTPEAWAETVCERLENWGFNTIGAWSVEEVNPYLPRTPILNLSRSFWFNCWDEKGLMPDFYSSEFKDFVEDRAQTVEEHVGDPMIVGYFLDNELPWAPDHNHLPELFDGYVAMPADAPGKQQFAAFMKERYETVEAFNKVWKPRVEDWSKLAELTEISARRKKKAKADREAFTLEIARQYFNVTTEAVRKRDPGRLVLGCRFMPYTVPKAVVQACGEYCDVISINYYETLFLGRLYFWWQGSKIDRMPQTMNLDAYYDVGKRPLMVTEFTSRLKKEGHNTWPPPYAAQPVVKTEEKRAARYEKQVMSWLPKPWFVGVHWFEHADQPKEGRAGDGENSVFGLVNIKDEPYDFFVKRVAETNQKAWKVHAVSTPPVK